MRLACATLVVRLFGSGVAHAAEAVTYSGSILSLPIILEVTWPGADGLRAGLYADPVKGGDIALNGMKIRDSGTLQLPEETPCTKKLCKTPDGHIIDVAPIAGN